MGKVSVSAQREAVIMRIVTVCTLIYLPATFVSTFFGTDIIKYQNDSNNASGSGSFSTIAMTRWLAITVPLTLLTLILAYTAFKFADKQRNRHMVPRIDGKRGRVRKSVTFLSRTAAVLSNLRVLMSFPTAKIQKEEVLPK
jgi:heme/copper-type cytochrome/quinol oxidase subunit 2